MKLFADAFIPLSPVAPIAQLILLVVIIVIEGIFIRKQLAIGAQAGSFWLRMTGVNVLTALLGVIGVLPAVWLESYLLHPYASLNALRLPPDAARRPPFKGGSEGNCG